MANKAAAATSWRWRMLLLLLLAVAALCWIPPAIAMAAAASTASGGRRSLLGFVEAQGNSSYRCTPSGPCIPCQYSEKEMDSEHGDNMVGNTSGGVVWTNAMSAFVLAHLSNLVASGNKTSTGFKKVHLNNCARALNEHLRVNVTGDQVQNHLRKWKKFWGKIGKLRNLSGALWDENTSTIRLEHGHYTSHVKDHRGDADYLNTPIEHYHEMATIFGNSMATGKYAKGANDPIGTDVNEISDDETTKAPTEDKGKRAASGEEVTMSGGGDSSASKPPKRAKISNDEDLYSFMTTGIERLAKAIEKAGTADTDVPEDLWDNMMDISGFEEAHLTHYYAYLCENVSLARAFNKLSLSNKKVWVARYISNNNL